MQDNSGRSIDYLRISVTDLCNLRCVYCMPEQGVPRLDHADILTFEEIFRLVNLFAQLGLRHIRLTGGEPMVRRGIFSLIEGISAIQGIEDISMTTNGLLLKGRAKELRAAGVSAVNVSLDTLNSQAYSTITRGGCVQDVLLFLDEALEAGIRIKINAVPVRDINEEGLTELAELAKDRPIDVRFIELMPLGEGSRLRPIPTDEMQRRMQVAFGEAKEETTRHGYGPAVYIKPDGFMGSIGFISPISHAFCSTCNRVRLTADGMLKLCLNHQAGLDLRQLLRSGADDSALLENIRQAIERKPLQHGFGEKIEDREVRRMNEIGG